MVTHLLLALVILLESSLQAAAQTVSAVNVTENSATIVWDISIEGAIMFEISVNCRGCAPREVSANETSEEFTELRDNTKFRACVTPLNSNGIPIGVELCTSFRTQFSPETVGALCVGIFLVVSFLVLVALDILCRRHQIEVEDAKRAELLQQGWQTFKRSKRIAKKAGRASSPSVVQPPLDDGFENIADITLEEELD